MVAKPISGAQGQGVSIIDKNNFFFDKEYIYQELSSASNEKRIVFLDGKIIASRYMNNRKKPWELLSKWIKKTHYSPTNFEKEIVQNIISQTGLEFGSVDFLGEDVLEINGSGTGTIAIYDDNSIMYDLKKVVCDYLELK